MIKGIHHVSLKCSKGRQYNEVLNFYSEVLGMSYRTWGDEAAFLVFTIKQKARSDIKTERTCCLYGNMQNSFLSAGVLCYLAYSIFKFFCLVCTFPGEVCVRSAEVAVG